MVGVIEQTKGTILQTNPGLTKDLDEVSAQLRNEYQPRIAEFTNEIVQLYAQRFTEQELKDVLAFYKSPLGKKVITEEPIALDMGMKRAQTWADVETYLKTSRGIIVPIGSTEQHGPNGLVGTDAICNP